MKKQTRKSKMARNPQGPKGKSKYAQKVKSGRQMYGNGRRCCGHVYTPVSP